MEIIPAMDLRGGRCVRLRQGDYERQTAFDGDPLDYALRWEALGARRLHVVDLDAARSGAPVADHWRIVGDVCRRLSIPVQLGGGIRSLETARAALSIGVDRVIVGTAITTDEDLACSLFSGLGEAVVAGVDARDGVVSVEGWTSPSGRSAPEFARRMQDLGAKRIIYTDIGRDGTGDGPNVAALNEVASGLAVPVVASGGVGSVEHIRALALSAVPNVEAVIVGRALYVGRISLDEAIKEADRAV
jgi:phosphoribosylformimino-5-aminoimidazole carboxamide ribotide isomerase